MKQLCIAKIAAVIVAAAVALPQALAETRVTYKSAKPATSYYLMAAQVAEAVKKGSGGNIIVTVEESQGSVQNVTEVLSRGRDYVFTSPPSLVNLARGGKKMFEDKASPKFGGIRALFPIPSLTMHFVARRDSGVRDFADLAGKTILLGKGSFGAREGAKYLELFGLKDKVTLADAELSNAVPALRNGQIDGFVTAGSYPAPNVIEAAAGVGVVVLSLSDKQIAQTKRTKLVIPAGVYEGQERAVATTSLPVIAYATADMDDETAYSLTKIYWEGKASMGEGAPWWNGVSMEMLSNIKGKIHPGALKYYKEADATLADHHM